MNLFINFMIKSNIKKIVRYLYISDLLHFFLVKSGLIQRFGLLGFGEAKEIE